MIFVELLAMADDLLGEAAVDEVLDSVPLSSGGAYSTVGNYPCSDLMHLVGAFSDRANTSSADLQRAFGKWMHARFVETYPTHFAARTDALSMLEAIEGEVHVEVRKLYPDAELPTFESHRLADGRSLRLIYRSPRALPDVCHGLIEACVLHFGQPAHISRRDLSLQDEHATEFTVRMAG
ncbi:heme NO-binding domain-containing protein [Paracoccus salsus]|uniref:heme NO-binding domain-containing protein n=1 Tax=Paracoccus salsus TaxID=2911061 RepID=UPI001F2E90CE|nr:heme NO-binding domain-containing protein [Paracoccus salsus]MCF3973029.1 heme NO-binding domain-containing protein [Paracoccus salsus]